MAENTVRTIPTINAVEGFNPAEFTRELSNEDGTTSLYLDVKYRLLWFRLHRPEGKIISEIIHIDEKSAVVSCKLYENKADPADQFIAQSSAQRFISDEKFGDRYLEIAETAALGRVLAAAGYGTQFCGATDMLSGIMADAPVDLSDREDDDLAVESESHVTHQTRATQPSTKSAQTAPSEKSQPTPDRTEWKTLDDYINNMTLEDAKNVVVDVGYNSGKTLGDIALRKPGDLDWYAKNYSGRNLALKAGAILLVQAAMQKAS